MSVWGGIAVIFVTGPMFSGKYEYLQKTLGLTEEELAPRCARNVEALAAGEEDLEELAGHLAQYDFVTASEVGCGVVPTDPEQRESRERAGRLSCLLAGRADVVIRVCCGLPQVLKGDWKC